MELAQTQDKGNKKTYLKPEGWRLLPEIPWKTQNIFNELAALGKVVGIQNIRSECWSKSGKAFEKQSPIKTQLLSRIKSKPYH